MEQAYPSRFCICPLQVREYAAASCIVNHFHIMQIYIENEKVQQSSVALFFL
jgi:hypothetical protein